MFNFSSVAFLVLLVFLCGTSGVSLWYFWCFSLVLLVFTEWCLLQRCLRRVQSGRPVSTNYLSTQPLSPSDLLFRLKLNEVKCLLSEAPNYFDCGCFGWSQSAPIRTIKKIGRVSEIREIRTLRENCGQQQSTKG